MSNNHICYSENLIDSGRINLSKIMSDRDIKLLEIDLLPMHIREEIFDRIVNTYNGSCHEAIRLEKQSLIAKICCNREKLIDDLCEHKFVNLFNTKEYKRFSCMVCDMPM